MYLKALKGQWKNLCSDFYQDFDILKLNSNDTASFNSWYSTRIHRWNSVAYAEGIILDQQNNPQLSSAILASLGNFRFRCVDKPKEKSAWSGIIASAVAGAFAAFAVRYFLDWKSVGTILTGAMAFIVCAVSALRLSSGSGRDSDDKLRQEYLSQLEGYWSELETVCRKFDVL